ncbi:MULTISPECIES: hypothetical protein [unclassified Streptomyces]|uniref:hypothetical protein n=1 Tax=unclassified Streptomyces TaxID=2593676 RepID=UPI002DDADEC0|nr:MULTISPECIES: hypothetical protein [unclassified Streptomyces]WSC41082.1 hypothetical protein OHA08_39505 [Streptomyces sp. NBC_01763]WSC51814.1 hypothetical protein OG808_05680 [Streptomyces sp. NBC_01761]WSF82662.1 hypothetical protein OIE70_05800 [Streptomyces sp. NBC_01744]WSJ49153.1 hypothetical protein OG243_05990 [Streptomyces sp. NBC_01318]
MKGERLRFDGWIAGVGTTSGTRLVVGHWTRSPFGSFSDVMIQHPNGERLLLAPSAAVADFVATTYRFECVEVVPVTVRRGGSEWSIQAGSLSLHLSTGSRTPLGWLLRAVPTPLVRSRRWAALCNIPARLMPGVRTLGTAAPGRREWYGAHDLWPILAADAVLGGAGLGALAPLDPPVEFGFGSAPRRPALVRVTTTVELAAAPP